MQLKAYAEAWPLASAFTISRGTKTQADVVVVEVASEGVRGRGECVPYPRYRETIDGVLKTILDLRPAFAAGLDREALQQALPAGAARNAIDCALWAWEAATAGCRVHELLGMASPRPVTTAFTLSLADPATMETAAAAEHRRPLLKLKLAGDDEDADRVEAVRRGAPQSRIVVDANEAGRPEALEGLLAQLNQRGVELVEQPLPAHEDAALARIDHPVPICADESCHTVDDLPQLLGRYDVVNIKLDKTGGLTQALRLQRAARNAGLGIMVGCMVGTSLSMAPAALLAQDADVVDLDGPLLLAQDRDPGLVFEDSLLMPPEAGVWDG